MLLIIFFSINDDEAERFDSSAELSISQNPELYNFDFSQILDGFDFSSIPNFFFYFFLQYFKNIKPLSQGVFVY